MRRVDSKVGHIRCISQHGILSGLTDAVGLQFPVGRTRLETVAVIVCAVIMSIATVLVIRESIGALVDGFAHRELPELLHAL